MCVCRFLSSFLLLLVLFCIPVSAAEDVSESGTELGDMGTFPVVDNDSVNVVPVEDFLEDLPTYSEESPLPVQIVPVEDVLPDLSVNSEVPEVVIGDEPPSDPVFYGSCWVTGTDSRLGTVTVYFPIDCREGVFGIDSNGYLFNISDSSYIIIVDLSLQSTDRRVVFLDLCGKVAAEFLDIGAAGVEFLISVTHIVLPCD